MFLVQYSIIIEYNCGSNNSCVKGQSTRTSNYFIKINIRQFRIGFFLSGVVYRGNLKTDRDYGCAMAYETSLTVYIFVNSVIDVSSSTAANSLSWFIFNLWFA